MSQAKLRQLETQIRNFLAWKSYENKVIQDIGASQVDGNIDERIAIAEQVLDEVGSYNAMKRTIEASLNADLVREHGHIEKA